MFKTHEEALVHAQEWIDKRETYSIYITEDAKKLG